MFVKKLLKVGLVASFVFNVLYADTVRITSRYANVRSGASTNYKKIGKAHRGDGYDLISTSGSWVKISFRGGSGWIHKPLIDIENDREEEVKSGCIEADIASWAPTALNFGCCAITLGWGCVVCTTVLTGGEIVAGDSMDSALEGALCD
jgi:hypothetical protein